MPTNPAQGLLIVIALLAGNIIPLTPVLILWMNMATSATLSFGRLKPPSATSCAVRRVRPGST